MKRLLSCGFTSFASHFVSLLLTSVHVCRQVSLGSHLQHFEKQEEEYLSVTILPVLSWNLFSGLCILSVMLYQILSAKNKDSPGCINIRTAFDRVIVSTVISVSQQINREWKSSQEARLVHANQKPRFLASSLVWLIFCRNNWRHHHQSNWNKTGSLEEQ